MTVVRRRSRVTALLVMACLPALAVSLSAVALGAEELPSRFREAVAGFLAGNYKECQIAFGRAAAEAPRTGLAARAAYGAACCAALRNDVDGGFEALGLALANGFHDLERVLVDPRLESLRGDANWLRFLRLTEERQQAHQKTLDPDLLRLYLEQRQEREAPATGATTAELVERAAARRRAASERVEGGGVKKPEDAFHAASLLVESDRPAEVERAAGLARQALAGDPDLLAARPLVATAVDRGRLLTGKPQKYGTQLVEIAGQWKVYDVAPEVTDEERAEWGLPPLAEAYARAAELHRTPPPAPAPLATQQPRP